MLKKLTLAGVAFLASSTLAFADDSNMDPNANADASSAAASSTEAAPAPVKHKHHKKHKKHHHRHHYQAAASNEPMAEPMPAGGYKSDVGYKGEGCPTCPRPVFVTGAYLGFDVGSLLNYTSSPSVYNGLQGTLMGGYSMMWDQIFGALEIFIQDNAEITNNNGPAGSAKSSWGYGLSILPGYLLTDDVLGFLRLGVINSRFTSPNTNKTGGQVGLGLETQLTPCWDLRAEYDYSFYNSTSIGVPRSQQFNLGLLYKFQV